MIILIYNRKIDDNYMNIGIRNLLIRYYDVIKYDMA